VNNKFLIEQLEKLGNYRTFFQAITASAWMFVLLVHTEWWMFPAWTITVILIECWYQDTRTRLVKSCIRKEDRLKEKW
jgi:hypothetical protein